MNQDQFPPSLESRFLKPDNWRWHNFSRQDKKGRTRRLRFGSVFPKDKIPDAVVVCLPGLGDFCEKYFETARDCLEHNYAFWVIDWVGQGRSTRYLSNTHKRHSAGFAEDLEDLNTWLNGYVIPASVHPDVGRIPRAMLAHSMGGHIGLRYLTQNTDMFACAAFSAPMWGIKAVEYMPRKMAYAIAQQMNNFMGQSYVPGGANWSHLIRAFPGKDIFTSDTARGHMHNTWCLHDPALQVGGVTNKWLFEAVKSVNVLHKKNAVECVKTPIFVGLAGQDMLVSNQDIRAINQRLPNSTMAEFSNSQHEILMENDRIRQKFLENFHALIEKNIINNPEALKQF